MAKTKGKPVIVRVSAHELKAWRVDAERAGLALPAFLKARIREGAQYADLRCQIQLLPDQQQREAELLLASLHSLERLHCH